MALTRATAATLYVDAASTNAVPPFANWATAAVTIQDAVDAAVAGDEIVVTNGVYQTGARAVYGMSNRVAVTKPVTVRSVNGPDVTSIVGHGPIGENAIRCVYLTNGAVLAGFTLTNGATRDSDDRFTNQSGGGVWCESRSAVISNSLVVGCSSYDSAGGTFRGTLVNCTLAENITSHSGGGAFDAALNHCLVERNKVTGDQNIPSENGGGGAFQSALTNCFLNANFAEHGGGAFGSTLTNCTLTSNSSYSFGGGAYDSVLFRCTVAWNSGEGGGGGVFLSTLNECTLTNNFGDYGGGANGSALANCTLIGNLAGPAGGGVSGSTLKNCVLMGNSCLLSGGGASGSTLYNCTLAGNFTDSPWSDLTRGGGTSECTLNNCIVYYNRADWYQNDYGSTFKNSCTPDAGSEGGNVSKEPAFVDMANGNLRLQSNSPCINAGNNAYVTAATDLDGLPRIAGGTVDIGAYEFQSPASTISYAWLQQFGLPTDGWADAADTDHDGHNNGQEWMAGTNPTNALSALRLAAPLITPTNVTLTWTSVSNRTYTIEQGTNRDDVPGFAVLQSNIAGLPGTTSWTDTNAPVSSPRFYRLLVLP